PVSPTPPAHPSSPRPRPSSLAAFPSSQRPLPSSPTAFPSTQRTFPSTPSAVAAAQRRFPSVHPPCTETLACQATPVRVPRRQRRQAERPAALPALRHLSDIAHLA